MFFYFFLIVLFGSVDQSSPQRTSVSTSSLADLDMRLCCTGMYGYSHHNIWRDAHVPQHTFRYYDAATKGLDFKGLMEDIKVSFPNQTLPAQHVVHAFGYWSVQIVKTFESVMDGLFR